MTRAHRLVLGAVGGLIVVAFVAWAIVAAAGGAGGRDEIEQLTAGPGGSDDAGADADADATQSTATTYALVPVTGGAALPTTTAKPPPKPPPPPPDTFAAADQPPPGAPAGTTGGTQTTAGGPPPPPALTADGAVLTKPEGADAERTRSVDKAKGCYSAVDSGWRIVECGALKRGDLTLLWLTEQHPKTRGLRALILRERTAGQWVTVLRAHDDDNKRFSKIGVRGEDVSGDGHADLLFGFHLRTADKKLALDVVDTPGAVTLHRDLTGPATSVQAKGGQLDTWATQPDGTARHETIKFVSGAYRVTAAESVPRTSVPPSMV